MRDDTAINKLIAICDKQVDFIKIDLNDHVIEDISDAVIMIIGAHQIGVSDDQIRFMAISCILKEMLEETR